MNSGVTDGGGGGGGEISGCHSNPPGPDKYIL